MHQRDTDASDTTLALAAKAGDREAFGVLFSRHRPLLLALCRRWLGNTWPVEDIIQETALQAMLSLERLHQPERFGAWLAGIGLNLCRQWSRQRNWSSVSWDSVSGEGFSLEPVDWLPEPQEAAETAALQEAVRRAVAELPPGQRAAVVMFYLSGMTYAETAAFLGTEPGAIRTRLHNARQHLRRSLATLWQEEHMTIDVSSGFVELHITGVWQKRMQQGGREWTNNVVVLSEVGGARRLPIWIPWQEAAALALLHEKVQPPHPLVYTLMADLLKAAGSEVRQVRITRLADDAYYAEVVIQGPAGMPHVDARPSDALCLACAYRWRTSICRTGGAGSG